MRRSNHNNLVWRDKYRKINSMPKKYSLFPSVNQALKDARDYTFRGNTYGQEGAYHSVTSEDRERAGRFNVADAIQSAEEDRRKAGLS